eukprot:4281643-Heterocapsa_arctica.AAC.1
MKHLAVRELWLQDQLRDGKLTVERVKSEDNFADLMTKYFGTARHHYLTMGIGVCRKNNVDES